MNRRLLLSTIGILVVIIFTVLGCGGGGGSNGGDTPNNGDSPENEQITTEFTLFTHPDDRLMLMADTKSGEKLADIKRKRNDRSKSPQHWTQYNIRLQSKSIAVQQLGCILITMDSSVALKEKAEP